MKRTKRESKATLKYSQRSFESAVGRVKVVLREQGRSHPSYRAALRNLAYVAACNVWTKEEVAQGIAWRRELRRALIIRIFPD